MSEQLPEYVITTNGLSGGELRCRVTEPASGLSPDVRAVHQDVRVLARKIRELHRGGVLVTFQTGDVA